MTAVSRAWRSRMLWQFPKEEALHLYLEQLQDGVWQREENEHVLLQRTAEKVVSPGKVSFHLNQSGRVNPELVSFRAFLKIVEKEGLEAFRKGYTLEG